MAKKKEIDKKQIFTKLIGNIYQSNSYLLEHMSSNVDASQFIFISYETGGAEGGSYDGQGTTTYRIDEIEQLDKLKNNMWFLFTLKDVCSPEKIQSLKDTLAIDSINKETFSYTESHDYYGNYTDYEIVSLNIKNVFKKALSQDDYTLFMSLFTPMALEKKQSDEIDKYRKSYQEVNQKIDNFQTTKNEKHTHLENKLANLLKDVEKTQNLLDSFEKTSKKEEKNLEETKLKIEQFFDNNNISFKKAQKKKMK